MLDNLLGLGSKTASAAVSSALQYNFNKKLMKYQYKLSQQSLRESPSAQRAGLEAAGYNPMLAVSDGFNMPSVSGSSVSAQDFDVNSAFNAKEQRKVMQGEQDKLKAETDILRAEAQSAKSQALLDKEYADMELEAIKDDDYRVDVNGKDSNPTRSEYRQMIRNEIQRRRYTNSREHAISEDAVNLIHGGTSAFSEVYRSLNGRKKK